MTSVLLAAATLAASELKFIPGEEKIIFADGARTVAATFRNPAEDGVGEFNVSFRLLQLASRVVAPSGGVREMTVVVHPGQTVIEEITLDIPAVRIETTFFLQWIAEGERNMGAQRLRVCPTNMLAELNALTGGKPVILAGDGAMANPLKSAGVSVEIAELDEARAEAGRLVVLVESMDAAGGVEPLRETALQLAKDGTNVVWISEEQTLFPVVHLSGVGGGRLVKMDNELVEGFGESAASQRAFLEACRLAMNKDLFQLQEK